MKIVKVLCNKFTPSTTKRIKFIVIHYTAGSNPAVGGAYNNVKYYQTADISSSAHYFCDGGEIIYQSVEDKNAAWSVGAASYRHPEARNSNTLNIEMVSGKRDRGNMRAEETDWYIPERTVLQTIQLTRELMRIYNISAQHVLRHYDITGKLCPRPFTDLYRPLPEQGGWTWPKFQTALAGVAPISVKTYRNRLNWLLGLQLPLTDQAGYDYLSALKSYQDLYGLPQSGELDPATKTHIDCEYAMIVYYKGQKKPQIKNLKAMLDRLGYTVDTRTGKYGGKMVKAVGKYMKDHKIPGVPTGLIVTRACLKSIEYEANR